MKDPTVGSDFAVAPVVHHLVAGHSGADVQQLNGRAEDSDPREVLEWAAANIRRLAVASSFQSSGLVILHLLRDIRPDVPVLFLDTGWHFTETLEFIKRMSDEWDLNLIVLKGEHGCSARQDERYGPGLYARDPARCCSINKVEPLNAALQDFDAWISGIRRDQSATRSSVRIIGRQFLPSGKLVLNVHPLANWTKPKVDAYLRKHSIPTNPLLEQGFSSIGCAPCTRPVRDGQHERAGRWAGSDRTECGIHTSGTEHQIDAEL